MNIAKSLLAIALAPMLLAATAAHAIDPTHEGALAVPANRIVGLWSTEAATRPCGSGLPLSPLRNTLLFNAGGTLVESPRFAPAGVPGVSGVAGINQRGQALGTWSFNPLTGRYAVHLRFDWYVDGQYHGYQTVDRTITLSADNSAAVGSIQSTRYAANGSVILSVCGDAMSERL